MKQNKKEIKSAIKEAKVILKDIEKKECKLPDEEKDILKWSIPELRAYISYKTSGMGTKKKFKFANDLTKRIKEAKSFVK